jgi:hypothetical protein
MSWLTTEKPNTLPYEGRDIQKSANRGYKFQINGGFNYRKFADKFDFSGALFILTLGATWWCKEPFRNIREIFLF